MKTLTKTQFADKVKKATVAQLKKMGFRQWEEADKDGNIVMLFPKESFELIPEGFPAVDIFGVSEKFHKKSQSSDARFGALAIGVTRRAPKKAKKKKK